MDSTLYLVIFITSAAFNIHVGSQVHGNRLTKSKEVNCGDFFTLSCELHNSTECTWNRHGTFVKTGNKRYSFTNQYAINGVTTCFFHCVDAGLIDGGQWSCGTPADDKRNGIISKNFTVHVLAEYGSKCMPSTTTTTANPNDYSNAPITDVTWFIIVGALCSVLLILISVALIWICLKKRRHKQGTEGKTKGEERTSVHEYDEIDTKDSYLPPLPTERPVPHLKTNHDETLPAFCDHLCDGRFEMPIHNRTSLNPNDSDFILKLIAVRKPKDETSIDLAKSIELAHFQTQSTHPSATHAYQNIRHDAQI